MLGRAVLVVLAEVTHAQELIALFACIIYKELFYLTACKNLQRVGVEYSCKVLEIVGVGLCKEVFVKSYLCIGTVVCIYLVDSAANLASVGCVAALCLGVVLCKYLNDLVAFLAAACALYDVCALDTNFVSGEQTVILLGSFFHEVLFLDPEIAAEGYLTHTCVFVNGVIFNLKLLGHSLGVVCDCKL